MVQTPEIFTVTSFKPQIFSGLSDLTATKNTPTEIHTYHSGEKVTFSLYIKGSAGLKPQDIKSYTVSTFAKQKSRTALSSSLEVKVQDIISSTDISNLLNAAPPLNISLIRQNDNGKFNAATGSIFNLTLPDLRYLANASGKVELVSESNQTNYAPENACSADSDKICGSNTLNISNCITYKCWRFTKGSQIAKDCCRGLVNSPGAGNQNISSSSSGTPSIPTPTCNKDTKQIECKSTNIFYVPYCNKRYIPDCSQESNSSEASSSSSGSSSGIFESKPLCKPFLAIFSNSSGSNSSSGIIVEVPSCIPIDQAAEMYCNEVTKLPYDPRFSPSNYINDFCSYESDPEEKKGCCAGCGAIYDKITGSTDVSQDINKIRSCIDYNADGGYCDNFKRSETCVKESCYEQEYGSDELKGCCITNDEAAMKEFQSLKNAQLSEDAGMIYNIITFNNNPTKKPVKILKSTDDLIVQNFELTLPNDPNIDSVIIRAACQDTRGKIYNTELNIVPIPDFSGTVIAKDTKPGTCYQPTIFSLKVNNGGTITVYKGQPVEIPIVITDAELSLKNSLKITGLNSEFESKEVNKSAGYSFTLINGIPKTPGKLPITVTAENNCKPTKFTFDILVSNATPPQETPEATTSSILLWLPKVPFIGSELLKSALKEKGKTYTKIKYDLPRGVVAGSKISLEITPTDDLRNIDLSKLRVTWISSTNRIEVPSSTIKQLANGKIKLLTYVDKDEPEGIAKIILSDITDVKSKVAQAEVNVIKPSKLSQIKGKSFDKPVIDNVLVTKDQSKPDDKSSIKIEITGKNFIGRRAKINKKEALVLKKSSGQLSRFTYAEFRNSDIEITRIRTKNNNSTLIIKLQLPKNYEGGREELFISTPVGQTFIDIELPTVKNIAKPQSKLKNKN